MKNYVHIPNMIIRRYWELLNPCLPSFVHWLCTVTVQCCTNLYAIADAPNDQTELFNRRPEATFLVILCPSIYYLTWGPVTWLRLTLGRETVCINTIGTESRAKLRSDHTVQCLTIYMSHAWAEPQLILSLLQSNSLKFQPRIWPELKDRDDIPLLLEG